MSEMIAAKGAWLLFSFACIVFLSSPLPANAATLNFDRAPNLLFDAPQGWTACDSPTQSLLGGRPPEGGMKKLCDEFDNKGGAKEIGRQDGLLAMSFVFADASNSPITSGADLAKLTPQQVSDLSETMCASTFKIKPRTVPCVFDQEQVAGHTAIVGRVSTPNGEFEISHIVLMPLETGMVTFIFLSSAPNQERNDQIKAIVASIRFLP